MTSSTLAALGRQFRRYRLDACLSQRDLGSRVGRNAVRISEFERDLLDERWGRDRLTLFIEICDALGLEPMLVPRARAADVEALIGGKPPALQHGDVTSAFDELFIDLGDDEGEP